MQTDPKSFKKGTRRVTREVHEDVIQHPQIQQKKIVTRYKQTVTSNQKNEPSVQTSVNIKNTLASNYMLNQELSRSPMQEQKDRVRFQDQSYNTGSNAIIKKSVNYNSASYIGQTVNNKKVRITNSIDTNKSNIVKLNSGDDTDLRVSSKKIYVSFSPDYVSHSSQRYSNSNEKDSRGGIVRLRRGKVEHEYEERLIIAIQRWWRYILEKKFKKKYERISQIKGNDKSTITISKSNIFFKSSNQYANQANSINSRYVEESHIEEKEEDTVNIQKSKIINEKSSFTKNSFGKTFKTQEEYSKFTTSKNATANPSKET